MRSEEGGEREGRSAIRDAGEKERNERKEVSSLEVRPF